MFSSEFVEAVATMKSVILELSEKLKTRGVKSFSYEFENEEDMGDHYHISWSDEGFMLNHGNFTLNNGGPPPIALLECSPGIMGDFIRGFPVQWEKLVEEQLSVASVYKAHTEKLTVWMTDTF